jgi:predicted O-linked N-acetylglucosamine transferase (SPINDLY family)
MRSANHANQLAALAQGDQLITRLEQTLRELDEVYVQIVTNNRQTRRHVRELLEHARRQRRAIEQEVQHAQGD